MDNQVWLYERLEGSLNGASARLALFREPGTGRVRKAIVEYKPTNHPSAQWSAPIVLEHPPHQNVGGPS
jgi:hypothetical protein